MSSFPTYDMQKIETTGWHEFHSSDLGQARSFFFGKDIDSILAALFQYFLVQLLFPNRNLSFLLRYYSIVGCFSYTFDLISLPDQLCLLASRFAI